MFFTARFLRSVGGLIVAILIIAVFGLPVAVHADDNRGDLNLNGIPFELADANLFASYFESGLIVFTIDVEAQIAASDVNMDGVVLSVPDYVFLVRIVQGDVHPDSIPTDTLSGLLIDYFSDSSFIVSTWFEDRVGALELGYNIPSLIPVEVYALPAAADMDLTYSYTDPNLQISLMSNGSASLPGSYVPILEIVFAGNIAMLTSVSAVGYFGNLVVMSDGTGVLLGDVNFNEIPYEIADAVHFNYCLLYGDSVFTKNPPAQILATDVNQDGIPLTIEDLEYLLKVIIGEIEPGDPVGPAVDGNLATIGSDFGITVTTDLDVPAGALHLVYYAPDAGTLSVTPHETISGMTLGYSLVDDSLRILINDFDGLDEIDAGVNDLFTIFYDGAQPTFVRAQAAATDARRIDLTAQFCNEPMGDANGDGSANLLDALYIIEILYDGIPDPPPLPREADCNCNCGIDLLDLLALIDYLYVDHNPLCTCRQSLENCPEWSPPQ